MILSIESSCDDSSIAITEIITKKIIYHKKISQEEQHSCYGGVVPELASRLHAVALPEILGETKPYFDKLKAVAVTNQPGLGVTLLEGIAMAKTLAVLQKHSPYPCAPFKRSYLLFIHRKGRYSTPTSTSHLWRAYTSHTCRKF